LLLRLVESLFDTPVLTVTRAEQLLKVTYRAARQNVQKLVGAGVLHPFDDRVYGKLYAAWDIIRVVDQEEDAGPAE
jgi:hypothetical protein